MNGLESLVLELLDNPQKSTDNTYELFHNFNQTNGEKIGEWITSVFANKQNHIIKCNHKSDVIRKRGNEAYIKGDWMESLKCYTRALGMAEYGGDSYATTLANRSAALYSMHEYKYSLSDIIRCLSYSRPNNLQYKVYVRKIHCYIELGDVHNSKEAFRETLDFIKNNSNFTVEEKETYAKKLSQIILFEKAEVRGKCGCTMPDKIKNEQLSGASSLIGLRYNLEKGRHVIAECNIHVGDILYTEKAYVFAPIFDKNLELPIDKCYHCLQSNKALIPCPYCCVCLYCDNICREKSWYEMHKWECNGMRVHLWSAVGLGFPAFRIFLKNLSLGKVKVDKDDDMISSGFDSYELAGKLLTNLSKHENAFEFLMLTTLIVYYLESHTDFFRWLSDKIVIESNGVLKTVFGSILLRNIAQVASNASCIEHWNITDFKYVPKDRTPVAVGLFPAVSMMSHSCKTNISIFYINDTVVVKALKNIEEGEEILNCYGVDYRSANKEERQNKLKVRYHFVCFCEICKNPKLEIEYLNAYYCHNCSTVIQSENGKCNCTQSVDLIKYRNLEDRAKKLLSKEILCLEDIERSHKIMKAIYSVYHINLSKCYDNYKFYFLHIGEYDKAIKYFNKSLDIKKMHYGDYNRRLADEIIEFLECLKQKKSGDIKGIQDHLKKILSLHYPDIYIKYNELEILCRN